MAFRSIRWAFRFLCAAALLAPPGASAATRIGEGFATRLTEVGGRLTPVNHVDKAVAGGEIYHWVQWSGPMSVKSLRCLVRDSDGDTLVDDTDPPEETIAETYTVCGYDSDARDFESGAYKFSMYVDGELASEQTLQVEKPGFFASFRLSRRRQWKWALGALAGVFLVGLWIRKKMAGDHAGAAEIFAPEKAVPAQRGEVVIGSRVNGATATASPAPVAPPVDPVATFKKRVAADPAYRLPAEEVLPVAKAARSAGDAPTAIAALRGFDKANPGHALIPDVYLFSAKLMAEDLGNKDMARKVLEHLVQKYPGHHLAQEARQYLKAMPA